MLATRPLTHTVTIVGVDRAVPCSESTTVLHAVLAHHRGPIASGCHAGGCGVCRVRVLAGDFECSGLSRAHVSPDDESDGVTLACRTWPRSDLTIQPIIERRRTGQPTTRGLLVWES